MKAYHTADKLYLLVQGSVSANNQFYLDVDDNGATGYGDAAQWSDMGADYLIENGTLFAYAGDGSSFAWNPVASNGGLVLSKTSGLIELEVPRASLNTLGAALRVGYSDLDGTFSPVAKLPASGNLARYTLDAAGARTAAKETSSPVRQNLVSEDIALTVYPNPGREQVTIAYTAMKQGFTQLEIYDVTGRLEKTLLNKEEKAGNHSLQFDAQRLGAGVHLVRMQLDGKVIMKKLVVR